MSHRADTTWLLCWSKQLSLQSVGVKEGLFSSPGCRDTAGTSLIIASLAKPLLLFSEKQHNVCCLDTSCPSPLWCLTLATSPSAWLSVALQLHWPTSKKQQHVYSPRRPDLQLILTGSSSISQINGYDSFNYRAIPAPLPRNRMNNLQPDRSLPALIRL